MTPQNVAKALFVLVVLVVACFGTLWLAGIVFFLLAKVNPAGQTDLSTWWTYWKAYQDDPAVSKRLLAALGIAFAAVFGAVAATIIAGMRQRRSLHGEARFANASEVARAGLSGEDGIIVGKYRNRFLMFGGMQFVLLAAPTRSGKGVGIVIPNLLNWSQSVVVLDVKQENFMVTSGYRAKYGQDCYLFNPFSHDGTTHRYNPLGYVSDDPRHRVGDLLAIGTALYPGEGRDSFFDEAARNLFLGLGLMIFETEGWPRTIGEMLRQSSGKGVPIKEYLQGIIDRRNFREYADVIVSDAGDDEEAVIDVLADQLDMERLDVELMLQEVPAVVTKEVKIDRARELMGAIEAAGAVVALKTKLLPLQVWDGEGEPPLSPQCRDALSRFLGTSDNTLSSILASFNVPLTLWASPIFDAATSDNDFDLRDVRKRRMSIYLGIPANRLAEAELILNLFFTQLVNLNTDDVLGSRPELRYQCLLLMDEFTAPGRIAVIDKANAYMAGYGLRLLTIIQSPGQLEAEPRRGYGRESARTLVTNHACQILYTPREQRDANEYSEMLGFLTFKSEGRSWQTGGGRAGGSRSESDQKRALMLPQELKEMGQRQQIINLENCKPILCDKIAYYEDDKFLDRLREISPSLARLGAKKPDKKQLETAWGSGELASFVPKLDLDLHQAVAERRTREATPGDVAAGVDLRRIALDTSAIKAVASAADMSPAAVTSMVDEFFDTLYASNGIRASELEDDDTDEDGSSRPLSPADLARLEAEAAAELVDDEDDTPDDEEGPGGAVIEIIQAPSAPSPMVDIHALYDEIEVSDDFPIDEPEYLDDEFEYLDNEPEDVTASSTVLDLSILDSSSEPARH